MTIHHVHAEQTDGFRRMSGEDEMMFKNPSPFQANVSEWAAAVTVLRSCYEIFVFLGRGESR